MPAWRWLAALAGFGLAGCAVLPTPPDGLISGSAITLQRQYVPADAQFEAVLLDVTARGQAPLVLARQRIDDAGPPPYPLRLPYHVSQTTPQGHYEVRAQVRWHGRMLLTTPGVHQVLLTPEFRHVDPILAPVAPLAATAQAAVPLRQTYWLLQDIVGTGPLAPPAPDTPPAHLVLDAAGTRASGSGGCNRFIAPYTQEGSRLRFATPTTSLRLCLDGGANEAVYLQRLSAVAGFWQQNQQLELRDAQGQPLLRFRAELRDTLPGHDAAPQAPQ